MTLRIIRTLWLFGHVAGVVAWHLPQSPGVTVMGVAVAALMVAYLLAIGRALILDQGWWAGAIAFCPLVMWGYVCGLGDLVQPHRRPQQVRPPSQQVPEATDLITIPTQQHAALPLGMPW